MLLTEALRLEDIFRKKGWENYEGWRLSLNRLGDLISVLNEEERYLLFQLLENYCWAPNEVYNSFFLKALNRIPPNVLSGKKNIFFVPIYKKRDSETNGIKSSLGLLYLSKAGFIRLYERYEGMNIIPLASHNELTKYIEKNNIDMSSSLIIYCDDFMGTGKTVIECMEWVKSESDFTENDIIILGLIGMSVAQSRIEEMGYHCYFGMTVSKGITDYFRGEEIERYKEIMQNLEKNVEMNQQYSLGYEQSEATVSMIRTPNNTFPVFWNNFRRGKTAVKPVFPRF